MTHESAQQRQVNGRWVIVGFAALLVVVVVGYFVLGMPGMDHGGSDMAGMGMTDIGLPP